MGPLFGPITKRFERGKITTLLGPNGTGKTTFLNVIAGRLQPSTGVVRIGGCQPSINDFNYMPQDSNRLLFPHLTLRQNLRLLKDKSVIGKLKEIGIVEQFFPNQEVLDKYPDHCSGGQKQRTVLCRALSDIPNFPVVLFDEPFAQISQDVKPRIYALLHKIVGESGAIALLVTHDIPEALIVGDQVMVLSKKGSEVFDASNVSDFESYFKASQLRDKVWRMAFLDN